MYICYKYCREPGDKTVMPACTALFMRLSRANIQCGFMLCDRSTVITASYAFNYILRTTLKWQINVKPLPEMSRELNADDRWLLNQNPDSSWADSKHVPGYLCFSPLYSLWELLTSFPSDAGNLRNNDLQIYKSQKKCVFGAI